MKRRWILIVGMVNKTSIRFLLQFVLIVGVSFGIIFAVGYYTSGEEPERARLAAPVEE